MIKNADDLAVLPVGARIALSGGSEHHAYSIELLKGTGLRWMPVRHALLDMWGDEVIAHAKRIGATIERITP